MMMKKWLAVIGAITIVAVITVINMTDLPFSLQPSSKENNAQNTAHTPDRNKIADNKSHATKSMVSQVTNKPTSSDATTVSSHANDNPQAGHFLAASISASPSGLKNQLPAPPSGRNYEIDLQQVDSRLQVPMKLIVNLKHGKFQLDKDYLPTLTATSYLYMQLNSPITEAINKELQQMGVETQEYIPNNAWVVKLAPEALIELKSKEYVYALGEIHPMDKFPVGILERGFSDHSTLDSGLVKINVSFRKDINHEQAVKTVAEHGGEAVTDTYDSTHSIIVKIPLSAVARFSTSDAVSWIEDAPTLPVSTNINAMALSRINSNAVRNNLNLFGNGVRLGIWEAANGVVDADHQDLTGRVQVMEAGDETLHATHVAGTMIGNGTGDANAVGAAPQANLWSFDVNDGNTFNELRNARTNPQIRISASNHSWSWITGWQWNNGRNAWEFWNNQATFGAYTAESGNWDDVVFDTDQLIVVSAGNDRNDNPAAGIQHFHGNGAVAFTDVHPRDGDNQGFDTVGVIASAKNIIAVGATNDAGTGLTNFSSFGPTDDGRIKPDLVADGNATRSTFPNDAYGNMSGTSMAAPVVTGASALLVERYRQVFNNDPTAATLKAYMIHTAQDINNVGPDYRSGWGLLNIEAAVNTIGFGTTNLSLGTLRNIQQLDVNTVQVGGGVGTLRATLVWTDIPAALNAAQALVNDLDIVLVDPNGVLYRPWILDPANRAAVATRGINNVDNIEQVVVNNPMSGIWRIQVSAGQLVIHPDTGTVNQPYSMVSNVSFVTIDSDGDLLSDAQEFSFGTDPHNPDTDGDGLNDFQEICFDGDCATYSPYPNGRDTNATNPDSDNDGELDGVEVANGRNPIVNEVVVISIISQLLLE